MAKSKDEKKKKKKPRKVRSAKERLDAKKREVAEMEAKLAIDGLKTAVKDGRVSEDQQKEYKKLLRYLKTMEKAPAVFLFFEMDSEANAAAKLRDSIIEKLKEMVGEEGEGDPDTDADDEEESEEESDEESDEEEGDDDDDDDEDDDDDDDDDDEDEEEDDDED